MVRRPTLRTALAEQIRREGLKLVVLIVLTAGVFLFTRWAAASSHATSVRDAESWYARGQQALAERRFSDAVDDFRHAVSKNPSARPQQLALAGALTIAGQTGDAERVLLSLREASPEDAEVNLRLARLAVSRRDRTAATRYFRNALYAPPSPGFDPEATRLELVEFLLSQGDRDAATSELLAVRATVSPTAATHGRLGSLFVRAGDDRVALDEFQRALRVDPHDVAAAEGAAGAAFRLADYHGCLRYLAALPAPSAAGESLGRLARLVVERDPLEPRQPRGERRRRAMALLRDVRATVSACAATEHAVLPMVPAETDADTLREFIEAIGRLDAAAVGQCGSGGLLDEAIPLIVRRHRGVDGA